MDKYIEKFIKLCKNVAFEPKKNQTKLDVIKHNSAIKKLFKLCDEIGKDKEQAKKIYTELMDIKDETIQLIAASHCLKLDIYIDRAQKVLKDIIQNSQSPFQKFNAELLLETWQEGKL